MSVTPAANAVPAKNWFAGLTKHMPPSQVTRYMVVGGFNTLFGYGTYAGFTLLLERFGAGSYLAAMLASNLVNITVAFLGYKWFVFKTRGNYLREWLRCVSVYSGNILFGFLALPGLVYLLRHRLGYDRGAPYVGGAILTAFGIIISFFGHKHISFRTSKASAALPPRN